MEKKIFIGLVILIVFGFSGWYILIDQSNDSKLKTVDQELKVISAKLNNARHAQMDYDNIQKRYEEDQKRLVKERTRFVGKGELSDVTSRLQKFAKEYKLKLMDFSPALEAYFSANPDDKIVSLPIEISLQGEYLDVGVFLENWHKLPFYLIPEQINIARIQPKSNILEAKVTASLYTWNE